MIWQAVSRAIKSHSPSQQVLENTLDLRAPETLHRSRFAWIESAKELEHGYLTLATISLQISLPAWCYCTAATRRGSAARAIGTILVAKLILCGGLSSGQPIRLYTVQYSADRSFWTPRKEEGSRLRPKVA